MRPSLVIFFVLVSCTVLAQTSTIRGSVTDSTGPIPYANVYLQDGSIGTTTNEEGNYVLKNVPAGTHEIRVSFVSYKTGSQRISVQPNSILILNFVLKPDQSRLRTLVITGTMKPVLKLESPVPVEVYTPTFFKSNPTPSVYEAMQNVNGVRPQVNCSVCNTGDIHINGLEGAYSMVMIDGMPIVSGLSTVYGLNGIPQSLIERVEVVKGPASTLYGSEAVGGLINIITKKTSNAPIVSADVFGTTWNEINTDVSSKFSAGKKAEALIGLNYFNFQNRVDNNNDNFTDVTLQDRFSLFNKWNFKRKNNRVFSLAARYVYEDRFGGDMNWTPEFRGGDSIYGESIYTSRWEIFGVYQLPVKEHMMLQFSANQHDQNSVYGDTWFIAKQKINFGQFTWDKKISEKHEFLFGAAMRYTYYDDNTPATRQSETEGVNNLPTETYLPGVFIQDEIRLNKQNKLLLGMRYDYNSIHGDIYTPRFNYKWNSKNKRNIVRLSFGTGYRVANVFTEDHAALTGGREVVFLSDLNPETSLNGNLNVVKKVFTKKGWYVNLDGSVFHTHFNNKIFADYDTDPGKIIYDNLAGYAISQGVSINVNASYKGLKMLVGATAMDVFSVENGVRERQELTEQFSGTWTLSYKIRGAGLTIDYTGNLYGPMELPTQDSEEFDDPRPDTSPWWSIQNLQVTKKVNDQFEIYGGLKNLLNWTPWRNLNASYLGNTADPFERNTPPEVLVFDPTYVYGPNQGLRGFLGLRYTLNKS